MCSGGIVVEAEATVLLKSSLSLSRVHGIMLRENGLSRNVGSGEMSVWRWKEGGGRVTSSAQHNRGDGPTPLLGPVSIGKEPRAVCSGGPIITFRLKGSVILGIFVMMLCQHIVLFGCFIW